MEKTVDAAVLAIALVLVPLHGTVELAVKVDRFRIGRVERARMGRIALWIELVLGSRARDLSRKADPGAWSRAASCA
jgi:hypothetical protein